MKRKPSLLFKMFKAFLWTGSAVLAVLLLHIIYCIDPSLQPVPPLSQSQQSVNVHLISYVNGAEFYKQNQNMLAMSAINRGVDVIYNYRLNNIDSAFILNHPVMNEPIGAGYWLWKPYLISETLKKIPEGDILIYADTGLLIRQNIRDYFTKGLGDKDILLFAYPPKEYGLAGAIASGDVFEAINCREQCRYGHNMWAGILVLRNSKQSRSFIHQWLRLSKNEDLLTGRKQYAPAFPEFVVHLHDQALLSVLAAKESAHLSFMPVDSTFFRYISAHRRKHQNSSLMGNLSIQYHIIERRLLNAKITKIIQQSLAKIFHSLKPIDDTLYDGYLRFIRS